MDGAGIETYKQYFDKLWEVFGFSEIPAGWKKDYHTEYDFMTDDDFLPFEKYTFVIKNYDEFMKNNNWEKWTCQALSRKVCKFFKKLDN